jgi:Tol biopolymer transport system component
VIVSQVVFSGLAGTATEFDIFTMNPDGTGMTTISNSVGRDSSPSWQP